ncbi:MAG: hypothetical protein MK137_09980 [Rickettsiales bacterium]|nr:hypothetical protein [Rickettsiales bacterium]
MLKLYSHYTNESAEKEMDGMLHNISAKTLDHLIQQNKKHGGIELTKHADGNYYMPGHEKDPNHAITISGKAKPSVRYGSLVNAFVVHKVGPSVQVVEIENHNGEHHHHIFGNRKLLNVAGNEVQPHQDVGRNR